MPVYGYACPKCGYETDLFREMKDRNNILDCDRCLTKMERTIDMPNIRPDMDDFSNENRGRGRYNQQLKKYVTSVNDATRIAKSKGYEVIGH